MVALNTFALVALIVTGVALLINIISLATDFWSESSLGNSGLWKYCLKTSRGSGCVDITDASDWGKGTRAAMFLAMFCDIGAIIALLLFMFVGSAPQKIVKYLTIGLLALAGLFNIIAIAVYADKTDGKNLGWSWGIGIGALILEIVAAVLAFLAKPVE